MFKVTSFGPYLKSFISLKRYIRSLERQLIVTNPSYKFIEQNLSMVIGWTPPLDVGVSAHISVNYQFHTMILQTH